jgi:hypothetical protein
MNKLEKVKDRLRTYYYYLVDVLGQLQEEFSSLLLAMKQAKTEEGIAFSAGEVAAHCVIIGKFIFYARHFSIPIGCLRSARSATDFERVHDSILYNPKALKEKLHAYQSYVRELGIQFKSAHIKASYEHASWRKRAYKADLYGAFTSGQGIAFYSFRSTLQMQAEALFIPLEEIGMIDPIPVYPVPVSFLSSSSESVPEEVL